MPLNETRGTALLTAHMAALKRKNRRPKTREGRQSVVTAFLRWQAERHGVDLHELDATVITIADVTAWDDHLIDSIEPVSRRTYATHVREYFRWALREALIDRDPTIKLELPTIPRRAPRPMAEVTLARAVGLADEVMLVILWLAAGAGLRAGEIARLSWDDLSEDGDLYVDGKGGNERKVNILWCEGLVNALNALPGPRRGPMIPRRDGKPLHYKENTLDKIANEWLHDHGFAETLHRLRHRWATVANETGEVVAAARLMGHVNLSNFMIYAGTAQHQVRTVMSATGRVHLPDNVTELRPALRRRDLRDDLAS